MAITVASLLQTSPRLERVVSRLAPGTRRRHRLSVATPATWVDNASLAALKGASAAVAAADGVVTRNTPEASSWLR